MGTPGGNRLIYVDRLRVLVLVGVFVIHVFSVFNPWDEWHITAQQRSRVLGEVVVLLAPWIMPLLMLLAGVTSRHSLVQRNNRQYVVERIRRLLLPLVIGVLVLVPPQVYLERRIRGQFEGSFWAFYPHFFEGVYPRGNLSWHHLWFLAHLFAYSVIALPLFRFWQGDRGARMLTALARLCGAPHALAWLALPLILERMLFWGILPERHMLSSDWSNHALLFVAYLYGFILASVPSLGAAIDAQWKSSLASALAASALLVAGTWIGFLPGEIPRPYAWGYLAFWVLYALGAWSWVVAVIGMGGAGCGAGGPSCSTGA